MEIPTLCVQEDQGPVREQVASQPAEGLQDGAGSPQSDLSGKVLEATLIKKKINFSSYMRKFRVEQLQSHI
jgi:hypothetical protein